MDKVDLQIAIELEKCLQPVQIPNTCSFWMIRTKSGVYYNEFHYKLVDCLEKCLIYGHIRRFAD